MLQDEHQDLPKSQSWHPVIPNDSKMSPRQTKWTAKHPKTKPQSDLQPPKLNLIVEISHLSQLLTAATSQQPAARRGPAAGAKP